MVDGHSFFDLSDVEVRAGLALEFEKHGHVISVSIMGHGHDREAIVTFKRSDFKCQSFLVAAHCFL